MCPTRLGDPAWGFETRAARRKRGEATELAEMIFTGVGRPGVLEFVACPCCLTGRRRQTDSSVLREAILLARRKPRSCVRAHVRACVALLWPRVPSARAQSKHLHQAYAEP